MIHPMTSTSESVKAFLAEDSGAIRERLQAALGAASIDVVGQAGTPQACISGILGSQPDVVVLDIQLDGGSGLEVLKAVRSAEPAVAFVVFSSHAAPVFRKRYLQEGAVRFLDKSTEFEELAPAVASAGRRPVH